MLIQLSSPLPKEYVADHVELYFKDQYLCVPDRELPHSVQSMIYTI